MFNAPRLLLDNKTTIVDGSNLPKLNYNDDDDSAADFVSTAV